MEIHVFIPSHRQGPHCNLAPIVLGQFLYAVLQWGPQRGSV